jgi:hypothetical protein
MLEAVSLNNRVGYQSMADVEFDPPQPGLLQRFAQMLARPEAQIAAGVLFAIGAFLFIFGTPLGAAIGVGIMIAGGVLFTASTAISAHGRPEGESIACHIAKSFGNAAIGMVGVVITAIVIHG